MTSKQEKLAAARRKLKEFQVKNKEADNNREKKPNNVGTPRNSKDYSNSSCDSRNSPALSQSMSPVNLPPSLLTYLGDRGPDGRDNQMEISTESNKCLEPYSSPFHDKLDNAQLLVSSSNHGNGLNQREALNDSQNFGSISQNMSSQNHMNIDDSCNDLKLLDPREFFNMGNKGSLDDLVKPLQMELENHLQTINILVQQKNDVQNALTQAHALLNKKTEEVEEVKQQVVFLTTSITNTNKRLKEAEEFSQKLHSEKEEYLAKLKESHSRIDQLQLDQEAKEEEFSELRKKYEEKSSENQRLMFTLQETQSELSLTQIQAQQFSIEGQTALALQVSDLQKENSNLKQQMAELERSLESERGEKDESSQKFHIYAHQCNVQLANLNSQLKAVQLENEKLREENAMLSKNSSELEGKEKNESAQSYETEIADLHDQLSALKEKTNSLEMDLKRKKEESIYLKGELEAKDAELNQLETGMRELEEENKKLLTEAETPKANERLLATMESDKVAAAKAVSQNVKLKEQIVELEEAFMKLSQEKLQLTDELAHEKHVRSELEKRLQDEESDRNHDSECQHGKDEHEPLVNDSNEIEELRNIVRQLQDDKMELTARLNTYETNKTERKKSEYEQHYHSDHTHDHEHNHEHGDNDCENAKVRLQQMEEKVRKAMNEIAVLDEEKEKLEHLVLQLQGETETIGEYITLYQRQRMMLKQKAKEKDIRLMQLSKDKEELKSKLAALDDLVQRLIAERESINVQPGSKIPALNSPVSDNTAGKIRALISEIGSTNLIANQSGVFEHCPCCSGRLITI